MPGRRLWFRLGTFLGCALLAVLVTYSIFYCIVIVPLFVRLFIELPLPWSYPAGLLMLITLDMEFHSSHRNRVHRPFRLETRQVLLF
jgi:hypothetical protein